MNREMSRREFFRQSLQVAKDAGVEHAPLALRITGLLLFLKGCDTAGNEKLPQSKGYSKFVDLINSTTARLSLGGVAILGLGFLFNHNRANINDFGVPVQQAMSKHDDLCIITPGHEGRKIEPYNFPREDDIPDICWFASEPINEN